MNKRVNGVHSYDRPFGLGQARSTRVKLPGGEARLLLASDQKGEEEVWTLMLYGISPAACFDLFNATLQSDVSRAIVAAAMLRLSGPQTKEPT